MKLFGKEYSFTVQRVPLHDFNGRTTGEVLLLSDMTDEFNRVRMQYNEKFSKVLQSAYSDIIEIDYEKGIAQCLAGSSPLFVLCGKFYNSEIADLKQAHMMIREHIHDNDVETFDTLFDKDELSVYFDKNDSRMQEAELRLQVDEEVYSWLRFTVFQVKGNDSKVTYLYCVRDINEEKNAEHDSLSMIFNRGAFVKSVESSMSEQKAKSGCAFYMIDVDDFKTINDCYGHNMGDAVIQNMGILLKDIFREIGYVGRMGGDEFAAYQCCVRDRVQLDEIATKLLERIHTISEKLSMQHQVTASIGIIYVESGISNFDILYQKADEQLYESKRTSKNRYTISSVAFS